MSNLFLAGGQTMAPTIRCITLWLTLVALLSATTFAQEVSQTLTNADVLKMASSGISEQTIVIAIERGPTKFDTSPQALIDLKKEGIPDAVLNSMLRAGEREGYVECVAPLDFVGVFNSSDPATSSMSQKLPCHDRVTIMGDKNQQFTHVRLQNGHEGYINSIMVHEGTPPAEASVVVKEIPAGTVLKTPSRMPTAASQTPSSGGSGAYPLSVRVLQTEQVPYTVQTGGGQVSTSCAINGTTNTNGTVIASGNVAFGNATSYSNLTMNCNSYQTPPIGWRHVLNAMLVVASNGNAYIIACDAAWRWSKCRGLITGDTFQAKMTSKGLAVQYYVNGKPKEGTYSILQGKVLGQ
jgi:hypothetical protein